MNNEDKLVERIDLEKLVDTFSTVFFILGRCPSETRKLRGAIEAYRHVKSKYDGDTSVYDKKINVMLGLYTKLGIPEV